MRKHILKTKRRCKKMGRNLKYQFKYCIEKNLTLGAKKHSLKKEKMMDKIRIFSYADRKDLIDFTANLANFLKETHPEIKLIKDIDSNHIQEFLNKKKTECSQATLSQYTSRARKTARLINNTFKTDVNFKVETPKSEKSLQILRDQQMQLEHFKKLEETIRGNGLKAIELSRNFGLRVQEIAKLQKRDIDLKNWEIKIIDSKGSRSRNVKFKTVEQFNIAQKLWNSTNREVNRIVPIKADSINKSINRALKKLDIKNEYGYTSNHSIRKLYAQEEYDRFRESGDDIETACCKVSEQLGHSPERGLDENLINRYIKNIW